MLNEAFGWVWIVLGFLSGALLGLGFQREAFLGGYGSWKRRLLRLGHISFFGLGLLNILFALGQERVALGAHWTDIASWSFVVGGVSMPICCAISAFVPKSKPLFAVPVLSLTLAGAITALGMVMGVLS